MCRPPIEYRNLRLNIQVFGVRVCVRTCALVCVRACVHVCARACARACVYVCACVRVHVRVRVCEYVRVLPVASTSRLSSVGRVRRHRCKRIPFKSSVRNLGVHLDQTLSIQQHISNACRTAYLELRRTASIRPSLTQSAQLISSAITSRLDYCNFILAGLPVKQISRLKGS